jgi:tyrosinase
MSGSAPTKYDNMVKLHLDATDHAHNTAYFLPWHRGYIREFERALQAIDPSICLPYWNWSVDSQAPENSPIFSNGYYGSHGDCVSDGAFGTWRPYYPRPHCLARKWKYGDNLGAFHSFEGINKIVTGSDSYDRFRSRCEMVAHPAPHVNIGGDMSEMYSPNDPLFWAHHGYVDYVWTQYQKRKGYDFSGPNGRGGSANKGDDLLGLPYKVEAVLDSHKLCYDYVDLNDNDLGGTALPPPTVAKPDAGKKPDKVLVIKVPDNEDERYSSRDRSNLNIIRYPDDADEEWCKRNKYDVKTIREYEGEYKQMYKKVNEIKGYVSPCSLWKRPTLCAPLIEKKKELYVDVKDYGRITVDYSTDVDPLQAYSNIKKRAEYCTPDVEYPEDKYRKDVENVVGKSAFGGAGTLKKVKSEDDVSGVSHQNQLAGLCVAATLAVAFNAL